MKISSLPPQYIPFNELDLCTNRVLNCRILFAFDNNVPFLIGAGEAPRVWLSIPTDGKGKVWQPLIIDNISFHPKVKLSINNKSVKIDTPDGIILNVIKIKDELAKVTLIDLRPFGINIYGNEISLNVMNKNYESNNFIDLNILFSINLS